MNDKCSCVRQAMSLMSAGSGRPVKQYYNNEPKPAKSRPLFPYCSKLLKWTLESSLFASQAWPKRVVDVLTFHSHKSLMPSAEKTIALSFLLVLRGMRFLHKLNDSPFLCVLIPHNGHQCFQPLMSVSMRLRRCRQQFA